MIENSEYKIDNLGDVKSKLKIGGSDKDKFVPNMNASFFSDEFYFNLIRTFGGKRKELYVKNGG